MPRSILLFLTLIALFNGSRVLREPQPDADRPMDFRTCYVGQAVLRAGHNPYQDTALKAGWQRVVRQEHLQSQTQPGLPNLPFLYPPWAAALFGLTVGRVPYRWAWPLWYAVVTLGLLAAVRLWPLPLAPAAGPPTPWWQWLLLALALKGTVPALLTGQPTFLALALGAGALAVSGLGSVARQPGLPPPVPQPMRPWLAGVLLGLAAFKVTLVLPFAAWFLWQKQWKTLAIAAAVVAGLGAVAVAWADAPAGLAPAYQHLLAQVRAQSFDSADPDYPLTQGLTLRLELGNVLEWLWPGSSPWHLLLHGALWLAAGLRLAWLHAHGARPTAAYVFLVVAALTLLTTYHLYYDALLLLPLLAYAARLPRPWQSGLLLLALPFLLPLNGVALALGNPVSLHGLYFLLPPALLGVLALLLARPVCHVELPTPR